MHNQPTGERDVPFTKYYMLRQWKFIKSGAILSHPQVQGSYLVLLPYDLEIYVKVLQLDKMFNTNIEWDYSNPSRFGPFKLIYDVFT